MATDDGVPPVTVSLTDFEEASSLFFLYPPLCPHPAREQTMSAAQSPAAMSFFIIFTDPFVSTGPQAAQDARMASPLAQKNWILL
jgi:hypothetical protein